MTCAHVTKLRHLTRCPVCGEAQVELDIDAGERLARVSFACGGAFALSHGSIIVDTPCPAGSHLAARLMNIEADGNAWREAR